MGIPELAKGFRCHPSTAKFTTVKDIGLLFWGHRESNCIQVLLDTGCDIFVAHDLMTDLRKWPVEDGDPFHPMEMRDHLLRSPHFLFEGIASGFNEEKERTNREPPDLSYAFFSDRFVKFPMKATTRAKRKSYRDKVATENIKITDRTFFSVDLNALVDEDPSGAERVLPVTYGQFKGDHTLIHLFWDYFAKTFPRAELQERKIKYIVDVDASSRERRRIQKEKTLGLRQSDAEADTILFRWIALSVKKTQTEQRREKVYLVRSGDTDTIPIYALHFWENPPLTVWEHLCFRGNENDKDRGRFCDLSKFVEFTKLLGFSRSLFGLFVIFSGTDFFQKKWLFHGVNFADLWNFLMFLQIREESDHFLLKTLVEPPEELIASASAEDLLESESMLQFYEASVRTISYCVLRMMLHRTRKVLIENQFKSAWEASFRGSSETQVDLLNAAYRQLGKGARQFRDVFSARFAEQRGKCFEAAVLNLSYWTTLENPSFGHRGEIQGVADLHV